MVIKLVALRKESVDRNDLPLQVRGPDIPSLSARRAWIEMPAPWCHYQTPSHPVALRKESVDRNRNRGADTGIAARVALRKESVDRNPYIPLAKVRHCESLSARRAWIEIAIATP